jgi:hypothetical protein
VIACPLVGAGIAAVYRRVQYPRRRESWEDDAGEGAPLEACHEDGRDARSAPTEAHDALSELIAAAAPRTYSDGTPIVGGAA